MHDLEKLNVYQRALKFSSQVRKNTKQFPKDEMFVLTSQFRRAADSIVLNVAEGAGDNSKKEFSKFIVYAIRSGYECLGCLDISNEEKYMSADEHHALSAELKEIISMLVGLRRSLLKQS